MVKDIGQPLRITKTRHTDVGPTLKMKNMITQKHTRNFQITLNLSRFEDILICTALCVKLLSQLSGK